MSEQSGARNDAASLDMRIQIMQDRVEGKSVALIAKEMGLTPQTVYRHIRESLDGLAALETEYTQTARKIEEQRLDLLWQKLLPRINEGDTYAINAAIKLSERRGRLLCLDIHPSNAGGTLIPAEIVEYLNSLGIAPAQLVNQIVTAARQLELNLPETPLASHPAQNPVPKTNSHETTLHFEDFASASTYPLASAKKPPVALAEEPEQGGETGPSQANEGTHVSPSPAPIPEVQYDMPVTQPRQRPSVVIVLNR